MSPTTPPPHPRARRCSLHTSNRPARRPPHFTLFTFPNWIIPERIPLPSRVKSSRMAPSFSKPVYEPEPFVTQLPINDPEHGQIRARQLRASNFACLPAHHHPSNFLPPLDSLTGKNYDLAVKITLAPLSSELPAAPRPPSGDAGPSRYRAP